MTTETKNALADASSAYLRSAMLQPVRWYQWGEEAFAAARRENKPILLDIGAVWCHWCHVMDRESYENPELAEVVNREFIAIKVDRDERPDIDSRYQAAVSAISGQGGWPLTAFLTSDGQPFFGGTYFPPDERWGRPGFKRVLENIAVAYRERQGEVMDSAKQVMNVLTHAESFAGRAAAFSPAIIDKIAQSAVRMFDVQHGGFGTAPKFPHPAVMDLLIDRYARGGEQYLKTVIETTLEKMAQGGVYDQLAGGFHRYSVDERWVVPHFEKMSYDNSELLKNYVHGFQATGNLFFAHVARDIVRWMDEWLSDRERGGFLASQDADINLDDDGDYFTWTVEETRAALTEEEAKVVELHYDIGEVGEMHHNEAKNVLHVRASLEDIAVRLGTKPERVQSILHSAKKKMYAARLKRPTPYVDKTVYVNWNALCVSAYLEAGRVLGLEEARRFALRSLDRVLAEAWDNDKGLSHVIAYSEDAAARPPSAVRGDPQESATAPKQVPGLLDDYAFTALACLDAYEATSDLSYFHFAKKIADAMVERFFDATSGGFLDAPATAEGGCATQLGALAARRKPFQDAPTPAGNPAAAIALLRIFAYTREPSYQSEAEETLEVFAGLAEQYGMFAGTYGIAGICLSAPHIQVIVVGSDALAERLSAEALAPFALNKAVLRLADSEAAPQNLPPVLAETIPNLPAVKAGETVAVVCSGFTCRPPVSDPKELRRVLREVIAGEQ
jgi:uncharacterized protein YyaL (SSP411 family)